MATKSFTSKKAKIAFDIDGEDFEAHGAVPADFMAQLADRLEAANKLPSQNEQYEQLRGVIKDLLVDASADRFIVRCGSWEDPVGLGTLSEVASWLMEQVSGRPTSPPPSSTDSPAIDGQTSTGGQPVEESTQPTSAGTDTST